MRLNGVNLGGWLVLERWMTPSIFENMAAPDEYSWCIEAGIEKDDRLKKHRDSWITEEDFKWISENGMDSVRLPAGYWLFDGAEPYVQCAEYVKRALDWAKKYNLKVLLDLHAAPGSQNGEIHSGKRGEFEWHTSPENISHTIEVLEEIAETFGKHSALWGIELLNEPNKEIPLSVLQDFYRRGYDAVRKHMSPRKAVVVSDAYRPLAEWQEFINGSEFENIYLDVHLYQLFHGRDKDKPFDEHIAKAVKWKDRLEMFGPGKVIVGEWSAALHGTYDGMDKKDADDARKLYMETQRFAFAETAGDFYWSYKTEAPDNWNLRHFSTKK